MMRSNVRPVTLAVTWAAVRAASWVTFNPSIADSFVDHIGANTHLNYGDTNYANQSMVADILRDIGIRHIRDNCFSWQYFPSNWPTNVDVLPVVDTRTNGQLEFGQLNFMLNGTSFQPRLAALEGPNEYDLAGLDQVTWSTMLTLWQEGLYSLKSLGANASKLAAVPLVAPSMGWGPQHATPICSDAAHTAYCDFGNMHSYPGGHMPSTELSDNIHNNAVVVAGQGKKVWATETGYHTAVNFRGSEQWGVDERTHGVYMPRLFLLYWGTGLIQRTYVYELLDQWADPNRTTAEACYGLVRYDYSYKPAAVAVKTLIGLLQEPGHPDFTPGNLTLETSSLPSNAETVVLQKSSGWTYVATWQEAESYNVTGQYPLPVPPVSVGLGLPNNGSGWFRANLYYLNSTTPARIWDPLPSDGVLPFPLLDEVTLLELIPAI